MQTLILVFRVALTSAFAGAQLVIIYTGITFLYKQYCAGELASAYGVALLIFTFLLVRIVAVLEHGPSGILRPIKDPWDED